MQGLGVPGWESPTLPGSDLDQSSSASLPPQFVNIWIQVENKHGEEKGIIVTYPTALCLSSVSSHSSSFRPPLRYIPQIPSWLHPSQPVCNSEPQEVASFSLPVSASAHSYPLFSKNGHFCAHRILNLSKSKNLSDVAAEVSGYVDSVARERERERLRLKRERETGTPKSPSLARSAPAVSPPPVPTSEHLPTVIPEPPSLTTFLHDVPVQPIILSDAATQSFYPSPPQSDPSIIHQSSSSPTTKASALLPAPPKVMSEIFPTLSTSFNPCRNVDTNWEAQSPPYLGIGVDMNLDFHDDIGMNVDVGMDFDMSSGSRGGVTFGDQSADFDDSTAFTDDDFSFFDVPATSGSAQVTSISSLEPGTKPSISTAKARPSTYAPITQSDRYQFTLASPLTVSTNPQPSTTLSPGDIHPLVSEVQPLLQPTMIVPRTPSYPLTARPAISEPFSNVMNKGTTFSLSRILPLSPPADATIAVHLRASSILGCQTSLEGVFDPIPFSVDHHDLDGKYMKGKFSLPSPPDDRDCICPSIYSGDWYSEKWSNNSRQDGDCSENTLGTIDTGWRSKYMEATDPRIGVVKKLAGVKRKIVQQGGREEVAISLSFIDKVDRCEIDRPEKMGAWNKEMMCEKISSARDLGSSQIVNGDDSDCDSGSCPLEASLPTTPLTPHAPSPLLSYFSFGPTLIHAHFQHAHLLRLSTPLCAPDVSVSQSTNVSMSNESSFIPSAPTPVSPTAVLGTESERNRSLESSAKIVAREAVENALWEEAWAVARSIVSTSQILKKPEQRNCTEIWLGDVRIVGQLLASVDGIESPLDMNVLFAVSDNRSDGCLKSPRSSTTATRTILTGRSLPAAIDSSKDDPVRLLQAPMIYVSKSDAIIQILPPAVQFWEKLGLGPKGGKKRGTIFVLFEEGGHQRLQQAESWMRLVSATFESKLFGSLVPGESSSCPISGLLPLRYDLSFRKTLATFLSTLPRFQTAVLILLVIPVTMMSFTSQSLRQVCYGIKKALRNYNENPPYFQLLPEHILYASLGNPSAYFSDLDTLCISVYNRILTPTNLRGSYSFPSHSDIQDQKQMCKFIYSPIFVLARPMRDKLTFVRASHAALGVVDRKTLLHVGYQVSSNGQWLLAACVDQRGEAHDLGVWSMRTAGKLDHEQLHGEDESSTEGSEVHAEMYVVEKVWGFVMRLAKKSEVEWRVVVTKLGVLEERELNAWERFLNDTLRYSPAMPRMQVTILSAVLHASWTFCSLYNPLPQESNSPSAKVPSSRSSSTSKIQPQTIFMDITTTKYIVGPYTHLPLSLPPGALESCLGYIPNFPTVLPGSSEETTSVPHHLCALPISTTTLVCIPASSPAPPAITMLHIHLLHVTRNDGQSFDPTSKEDLRTLHLEITHNFHDLSVLTKLKSQMKRANPLLPFHLAAVEVMDDALDVDIEH